MNPKKFLGLTILQFIIVVPLRIYFFNNEIFESPTLQAWIFWGINAVLAAAFVRRMGVMNFLESFFLFFIWFVFGLLLDLLITSGYTGLEMFKRSEYWVGYLVLGVTIFITHRKRHIHRRHELRALKHGSHGHPASQSENNPKH